MDIAPFDGAGSDVIAGFQRKARRLYLTALGLVACLSFCGFLTLRRVIATQHGDAGKINVSGRQRMLSQRSAMFASLLVDERDGRERERFRRALRETIGLFELSHQGLTGGSRLSPEMSRLYFAPGGADELVRRYVASVRDLVAAPDAGLGRASPSYRAIVKMASGELLEALDAVVRQYQRESERGITSLEGLETWVFAMTLVLLALEAFFIFKPMIDSLTDARERVDEQRARAAGAAKMAALGQMSAAISHEIANPLGLITLTLETLRREHPAGPAAAELKTVAGAAEHIKSIISGLGYFAGKAGNEELKAASVRDMVDETLEFCRPRFQHSAVDLRVGPIRPGLLVEMRRVQISEVLVNLLNNAYDAVSGLTRDRWVALVVVETADAAVIEVSNGGPPLSGPAREKVLAESFSTKPPGKGSGLGLILSKHIIVAHHGALELKAGAPHTTFRATVPKSQPPSPNAG